MDKKRVLFLCTGNSARSQMAEGLLRHIGGDKFEAFSADVNPTSCLHLYECISCHKTITPTKGSCCVICAYSDKTCPAFL